MAFHNDGLATVVKESGDLADDSTWAMNCTGGVIDLIWDHENAQQTRRIFPRNSIPGYLDSSTPPLFNLSSSSPLSSQQKGNIIKPICAFLNTNIIKITIHKQVESSHHEEKARSRRFA